MRLLPFKTIGFNLSVNVAFANKSKFYLKIKTNKIIQMNRNKSNAKNEKAMTNYQKLMNAKAYKSYLQLMLRYRCVLLLFYRKFTINYIKLDAIRPNKIYCIRFRRKFQS